MNMNTWTIFKDSATIVVTLVSAVVALSVYWKNASTRRVEFLYDLHTSFFVNETYKLCARCWTIPQRKQQPDGLPSFVTNPNNSPIF